MYCKRFMLGAVAAMMLGGTAFGEVLIGPDVRNGSFEWLGDPGVPKIAKATHWDTDPDGDVTNWTLWDAAFGGPATASNDSGTENDPLPTHATHGTKVAFLQGNNAAFNLTDYIVQTGDFFRYRWDYVLAGRGNLTVQLAYQDAGGLIVPITGTASTNAGNATVQPDLGAAYTAMAGHPAIGRPIALTIQNVPSTNFPELDNVRLNVNLLPGDVDDDGVVDADDFGIIRDHFRQNVTSRSLGDLDENGVVNFVDYLEWRANVPAGSGAENLSLGGGNVPEPTGVALAATAISALLACGLRRKRRSAQAN